MRLIARLTAILILLLKPGIAIAAKPIYTAIVDAGSGGTRLYFHRVDHGPYPGIKPLFPVKVDNWSGKGFEPDDGIDNYACYTGDDPAA